MHGRNARRIGSPDSMRSRSRSQRRVVTILGCIVIGITSPIVACSDQGPTGVPLDMPNRSDLVASVTGTAASSIDAAGRFLLATPTQQGRVYTELGAREAERLAAVWSVQFGPIVRRTLEQEHGGPINFRALSHCGRTLYARSPFEPPPSEIPSPSRKPFGPWWFVTLCERNTPALSIAVSAWATELKLSKGTIEFPRVAGNEFFPLGIPSGHLGEFPSAPEGAVTFAARNTGRRAVSVPELVMGVQRDGPPQGARWRIPLEGNAIVHSVRGDLTTNEVFVGSPLPTKPGSAAFAPATAQPDGVQFYWTPTPNDGETVAAYVARAHTRVRIATARRRADTPIRFELASGLGGN